MKLTIDLPTETLGGREIITENTPMPKILVVDDDRTVRHLIERAFGDLNYEVLTASTAEEALQIVSTQAHTLDACLLDILLPGISGLEAFEKIKSYDARLPVIFVTAMSGSDVAIEAMKRGGYDHLIKPLDVQQVRDVVSRAVEIRRKMLQPVGVSEEAEGTDPALDQIIGTSPEMQEVYKAIGRVASQDVSVLVQGESGTGKELVARAIYHHSNRSDRPYLAVNCAAIPGPLLESELFGHEKGAFTGADRRRVGKFEQCNGGTIFLDEIGDMPPELQSKMLRLLQEQEFERVGGNETITTDVRVIAATNQDLDHLVDEGEFREDLYYRLKGFLICLPPLRKRGDDIVLLVKRFLKRFNRELKKNVEMVAPETMDIFRRYAWPGNVRELGNVMRQSMLQATGSLLIPEFLPDLDCDDFTPNPEPRMATMGESSERSGAETVSWKANVSLQDFIEKGIRSPSGKLYADAVEFLERQLLPMVLRATEGNQSQASRILGITRGSLRNKLRSLNVSVEQVISVGQPAAVQDDDNDSDSES